MANTLMNDTDDIELVGMGSVFDEFVNVSEESQKDYLRATWLSRIIMQLVETRVASGLTQAELGERLGKAQSAIARLERSSDARLGVVFDYLAALGAVPCGLLKVESLAAGIAATSNRGAQPMVSTMRSEWMEDLQLNSHRWAKSSRLVKDLDAKQAEVEVSDRKADLVAA